MPSAPGWRYRASRPSGPREPGTAPPAPRRRTRRATRPRRAPGAARGHPLRELTILPARQNCRLLRGAGSLEPRPEFRSASPARHMSFHAPPRDLRPAPRVRLAPNHEAGSQDPRAIWPRSGRSRGAAPSPVPELAGGRAKRPRDGTPLSATPGLSNFRYARSIRPAGLR